MRGGLGSARRRQEGARRRLESELALTAPQPRGQLSSATAAASCSVPAPPAMSCSGARVDWKQLPSGGGHQGHLPWGAICEEERHPGGAQDCAQQVPAPPGARRQTQEVTDAPGVRVAAFCGQGGHHRSLLARSCPRSPLLPAPGATLVASEMTSTGCPGCGSTTAPALLGQQLG